MQPIIPPDPASTLSMMAQATRLLSRDIYLLLLYDVYAKGLQATDACCPKKNKKIIINIT